MRRGGVLAANARNNKELGRIFRTIRLSRNIAFSRHGQVDPSAPRPVERDEAEPFGVAEDTPHSNHASRRNDCRRKDQTSEEFSRLMRLVCRDEGVALRRTDLDCRQGIQNHPASESFADHRMMPDSRRASRDSKTRTTRIRFRFVRDASISPLDQLWTTRALPVDGLRATLRRFRKSHHLIRAGHRPRPIHALDGSTGRSTSRGVPAPRPSYACVSTQANS